jgi:undecaprenyl-diphosphatase
MGSSPTAAPGARFGARTVLAAVAVGAGGIAFGILLLLVQDQWDPLLDVDEGARDGMHTVAVTHHGLVEALLALSVAGSAVVYIPVFALVSLWLVRRGQPRLAAFVAVTWAGSVALNAAVKAAVHRARPVVADPVTHANGMSFPSGHAQSAVVSATLLLVVFLPVLGPAARRVALALAVAWIVSIGFARVALGVHFVSDVLAGYALGLAWVAAMVAAFRAWRREARAP